MKDKKDDDRSKPKRMIVLTADASDEEIDAAIRALRAMCPKCGEVNDEESLVRSKCGHSLQP
jgi:hypothetical protein